MHFSQNLEKIAMNTTLFDEDDEFVVRSCLGLYNLENCSYKSITSSNNYFISVTARIHKLKCILQVKQNDFEAMEQKSLNEML